MTPESQDDTRVTKRHQSHKTTPESQDDGQLAERLGVDPRSVRRWQNGHGPIPGPVIIALRLLIQQSPVSP